LLPGEKKRFDGSIDVEKKKYLRPPRVAARSTNSEKMPMTGGFQKVIDKEAESKK
jgi:hypothetical protein